MHIPGEHHQDTPNQLNAPRNVPSDFTAINNDEIPSYLVMRLTNEFYALPGTSVREITRWRPATPVPGTPDVLPGIINQRGLILPVVDPNVLLGFPKTVPGRTTRYVIMQHDDVHLALFVDAVIDFIDLENVTLESPPVTLDPQQARFLHAIVRLHDQLIALLDPEAFIMILRTGV